MPRQSLNTIKDLVHTGWPFVAESLGDTPSACHWFLEARTLPRTKQQSLEKEEKEKAREVEEKK